MILVLRLLAGAAALAGAALSALLAAALLSPPSDPPAGPFDHLFDHRALRVHCAGADDVAGAACEPGAFAPLAARAPLDARGFEGPMQAAFEAGETDKARRLAAHVLARNTRSNLARFILANEAAQAGDPDRFLSLYIPQFEIDRRGASVNLFAGVLASYSRDPDYFTRLERIVLETRPWWGTPYLRALVSEGSVPVDGLSDMFAEYPSAQPALLSRLINDGQHGAAYSLFSGWLSEGALARETPALSLAAPFNPRLLKSDAPAPFNWQLHSRAAEYLPGGGVYVFFEGRRAATFLSQTFPVEAGDWRLRLRVSGQASETGGAFRWRLACADGSERLASEDIKSLGAAPSDTGFAVTLAPGTCPFVRLSLEGVPGMFPQPSRLEILEIGLERSDASAESG